MCAYSQDTEDSWGEIYDNVTNTMKDKEEVDNARGGEVLVLESQLNEIDFITENQHKIVSLESADCNIYLNKAYI